SSLLWALSLTGAVLAEEIPSSVSGPSATRLPGPIVINRFVPPVPAPPKEVPAMRIDASAVRQGAEHRVTVLRGEASELPDIPAAAPTEPPSEEELARRSAFLSRYRPPVQLNFGATIYDGRISI